MAYGIQMVAEPLRSALVGTITGNYSAVGTPFAHPIRILLFQNLTDVGVFVTFKRLTNTTEDQFVVPASGFILLDITSDRVNESGAFIEKGAQVYVRLSGGAGATGAFYVTALYALGD